MVKSIQSLTARELLHRIATVKKRLWGGELWSQGSCISTVGRHGNEAVIRQYVRQQGSEKGYAQLPVFSAKYLPAHVPGKGP